MQTALAVATPLQLRKAYDSRVSSPALDWEAKLHERFIDFFDSAGDNAPALNSFLVMQVSTGRRPVLILGQYPRDAACRPASIAANAGITIPATSDAHTNAPSRGPGNGWATDVGSSGGHRL